MNQSCHEQLTPFEEIVIEAATSYRKHLASQIKDPTMRLAAFGAAALHQFHLRQFLIKEKNNPPSSPSVLARRAALM